MAYYCLNEEMCPAHHVSWPAAVAVSHSPHVSDRQKPWLAQTNPLTQLLVNCSKPSPIRAVMSSMTLRGAGQGAEGNFDLSEGDSK